MFVFIFETFYLDNWRKELETWWPSVSVICYHGSQESRRELRMQILNDEVEEFDIMITTYVFNFRYPHMHTDFFKQTLYVIIAGLLKFMIF